MAKGQQGQVQGLIAAGFGADTVRRETAFRGIVRGRGQGTLARRSLAAAIMAATTLGGCSPDRLQAPDPTGPAAAVASPAQMEDGLADLTCLGTNDAQFSPGLTFQTQTVDIEAQGAYTSCVSSDPAVTSGTYTASGEGTMNCLSGGHAGKFTITWNTGEKSTIEFTNNVALRPGGLTVVVATGTVIGGKFVGDRFDGTFTLFQLDVLACLGPPGVGSASGPTTLLFTSL